VLSTPRRTLPRSSAGTDRCFPEAHAVARDERSAPAFDSPRPMCLEHFGLRERPFSNAPDLRFVYTGAHHEQALAYLLHSVEAQAGVVLLTGESGVGKTTTCRVLLNRLPERVDVALILKPVPTPAELVSVICDELGVPHGMEMSAPVVLDTLHQELAV